MMEDLRQHSLRRSNIPLLVQIDRFLLKHPQGDRRIDLENSRMNLIQPDRRELLAVFCCFSMVMLATGGTLGAAEPGPADQQIDRLLRQLDAPRRDLREQAEEALVRLAARSDRAAGEAFLKRLPVPDERMPQEVQMRLGRIRQAIARRLALAEFDATAVTLSAKELALGEILSQIHQQTGNRLIDTRPPPRPDAEPRLIPVDIQHRDFWPTIDAILDTAAADLYSYSSSESLTVIERKSGRHPRREAIAKGHACYQGPFRIEATRLNARRGLRQAGQDRLELELEIAWEPRLQPIHLSQPANLIRAVDANGTSIDCFNPQASFDLELQPGNHAARLAIPLQLPPRSAATIAQLSGQCTILLASRVMPFSFGDLTGAAQSVQRHGSVTVALDHVRRSGNMWEVEMRLRLDPTESRTGALASHRGWAFQNRTYLIDPRQARADPLTVIEPSSFETRIHNDEEVGLSYFFKLPDSLSNYQWVYHTPTSIDQIEVDYVLKNLPLP
jgi:hypothetical protein